MTAQSLGGCANSFSAETDVSTPNGEIPIAEIDIGDTVFAYNELTGEIGEYEVTATINHVDEDIVHLYIDGELIETTAEHPFYTDEGEWVNAAELEVGDEILSLDGDYGTVENVVVVEDVFQPMYNLTVDEAHTFFIGGGDWLVHNTICFDNAKTLAEPLGTVNANSIRFTQDSIGRNFSNGNSVYETIDDLKAGNISPDDFPSIRVFEVDGKIFSLDNRRLYVFQQANIPIKTVRATASEIENQSWKFTTDNEGVAIRVRGGGR